MNTMTGRVAQIQGAVVDCEFPADNLPDIYEAVEIPSAEGESLVLEVQKHLGNSRPFAYRQTNASFLESGVLD